MNFSLFYELKLKAPFGISRSVRSTQRVILLTLNDAWGEASPNPYYGETLEGTKQTIDEWLGRWDAQHHPLTFLNDVHESLRCSSAAALDIALHDLLARQAGKPLYEYLGVPYPENRQTSYTIGIAPLEENIRKIEAVPEFPILKIKLGKSVEQDLELIDYLKTLDGKIYRIDANEGWSLDDARVVMKALAELGAELVEQPFPAGQFEHNQKLRDEFKIPIFLDEDAVAPANVEKIAPYCDGINIKLMKCGGIAPALEMIRGAREHDLQIMLGCMIESSVGITAGSHLAAMVDCLDLDAALLISNDPFRGTEVEAGTLIVPKEPGLGLTQLTPLSPEP